MITTKKKIQEERVRTLEREARKRNVIIYGVIEEKEKTESSKKKKLRTLKKQIDVEIQAETEIQQAYIIGKSLKNSNKERPIMVEFASTKKRMVNERN